MISTLALYVGDLSDDGQRDSALQPEPVQRREGVPLPAGHLGGRAGGAVERRDFHHTPGPIIFCMYIYFKPKPRVLTIFLKIKYGELATATPKNLGYA